MSLNEWFRSIFGTDKASKFSRSDEKMKTDEDYDNLPEGFAPFFDGSAGIDKEATQKEDDHRQYDPRFHFSHSADQEEMFRHFDGMVRDFDEMFRSMGITDFPNMHPDMPRIGDRPPSDWGSWRELLEKPDSPLSKDPSMDREPDNRQSSPFFGGSWSPKLDTDDYKLDTDIDKEFEKALEKGDFSQLTPIKPKEEARKPITGRGFFAKPIPFRELERMPPPGRSGESSSRVSVHTYTSTFGNGEQRVEERRSVEDRTGNRETTVTRKIGDQSQTVTTKRSPDGSEELVETTVNLDKDDKENFERRWNMASLPESSKKSKTDGAVVPGNSSVDTKKDSLFYNLFGSTFKGFPSSKRDE